MWLALIMALNVWFVIWPNQKRALGLVEADDAAQGEVGAHGDGRFADQHLAVDPDALAMTTYNAARKLSGCRLS